MDQEDLKWKQRAKRNWFREGDRNTKFFHACASQKRKKNFSTSITVANDIWHTEEVDIAGAFHNFFV